MSQTNLADIFNKGNQDDFSNLKFYGEYIKRINFECEDEDSLIFHSKKSLRTARVPKKKGIEFRVIIEFYIKESQDIILGYQDFKHEQSAREFFKGEVEESKFLAEKNRENKVFDGRRYFWTIDNNDNLTGNKSWF